LLSLVDIESSRRITAVERTLGLDWESGPELAATVAEHAQRGVRLQILLRGVLAAFVVLVVVIVPPVHDTAACGVIAGAYAAWAVVVGVWGWRGGPLSLRFMWLALFGDLTALTALTLLAGASAQESWTADVLVNGFFLVPLLAATQLRPDVCAVVVAPTIAVYLISSALTKSANAEPWDSIMLRTLVLIGLGGGCVALSWLQRSRVRTIGQLVHARTSLLNELIGTEEREQRSLAEHLHDGALQYLLAARHDLEDARDLGDARAFGRLDQALDESSRLLRSTVAELHPAVLEHAGLAAALRELTGRTAAAGRIDIAVELDGWDAGLRTHADRLLYATARELLANVIKHARATSARLVLAHHNGRAELVVIDDGHGIPDGALRAAVSAGHIGLASYRVRIEAADGTFTIAEGTPSGTIIRVELPARLTASPALGEGAGIPLDGD
jgi:two-component system NarL family sensor kinase